MTASVGGRLRSDARQSTFVEVSADSPVFVGASADQTLSERSAVLILGDARGSVQIIPRDLVAAIRLHEATAQLVQRLTPASSLAELPGGPR